NGRAVVIELLARRGTLTRQGLRALHALVGSVEFGLALHDHGLGGGDIALAQGDLCLGGRNRMQSFLIGGFGFRQLGLESADLHAYQRLAFSDEIAFLDQDVVDAAGQFGRDIDLGGFDTAVSTGETRAGARLVELVPAEPAQQTQDNERSHDEGKARPDGVVLFHEDLTARWTLKISIAADTN